MRILPLFLIFSLQLMLYNCDQQSSANYDSSAEAMENSDMSGNWDFEEGSIEMEPPRTAEPPPPPPPPIPESQQENYQGSEQQPLTGKRQPTEPPTPTPRRVIYTAAVRMQVADVGRASEEIRNTIAQLGGYISDLDQTNNRYQLSSTLTLRIPVSAFDRALDTLNDWSLFTDYRRLNSRDVTAEWVDIETRLQTKRAVRDRYIEVLRTRATKVEDILAAEEAIRVVTEEIESREGRLRYLRDQTGLSTITLELYQELEYQPAPDALKDGFFSRAGRALGGGWEFLQELLIGIIAAWPVWILLAVLFYFGRRFFQSRRRK